MEAARGIKDWGKKTLCKRKPLVIQGTQSIIRHVQTDPSVLLMLFEWIHSKLRQWKMALDETYHRFLKGP